MNNVIACFDRHSSLRPGGMLLSGLLLFVGVSSGFSAAHAQSVCLPAPRLLTTHPMGGAIGSTIEVTINGDNLEGAGELSFSHPGITAVAKADENGQPIANTYVVTIAADCPAGVHEARVMTRLGVSTSRIFSIGTHTEIAQVKPNTSLDQAMPLSVNSICNAVMTQQQVDYYSFEAAAGQRIVIDCAAGGIDSKLSPVLIVADAQGADLLVERRGGTIDFTVPADGTYVVKVNDLTYSGGSEYFYRLLLLAAEPNDVVSRLPATRTVSSFSWPPVALNDDANIAETEPNNRPAEAQQVTLPLDISGSFYPAADVDTFEFTAKKGDVWWVEVASERFGLATDPSVVVQHVSGEGDAAILTDVAEFTDIDSPVKISSNGYSYDGPPYNAGSTDIIGKLEITEDGVHRLRLRDLFGGTRNDPGNIYRLIVRKAQPDFALVGWALHMNLRNGDRNALSKPIALRGGATMPIEVVAVRRDGFDGEISLFMDNLPEGVTATGLKIPAGQVRGIMLITADQNAPRGLTIADFRGTAIINGEEVTRRCRLASMKWPVPDASQQIPAPRLLADVAVSACGNTFAPLTIAADSDAVREVTEGDTLTIPLVHTRRSEFSGANISLSTFGPGFEGVPAFDAPLNAETSEAVIDLAKLKTPPGDYAIAFYGSAVAKYRHHPEDVTEAEAALKLAMDEAAAAILEATTLAENAKTASDEQKAEIEAAAEVAAARQKASEAAVAAAEAALKAATAKAAPKDIVDIIVSTPIRIRVNPKETTTE